MTERKVPESSVRWKWENKTCEKQHGGRETQLQGKSDLGLSAGPGRKSGEMFSILYRGDGPR